MKTILLVVGNLVYDIILGIDWIVENRVIINGKEKAIRIDKLLINNEHEFSCTYTHPKIEEYVECLTLSESRGSFPDHKDDARLSFGLGNGHRFVASDDSFEDEINNAMRECQHLKESERNDLGAVLKEYKDVFSNIPGKMKEYECEFKFRSENPQFRWTYPIPLSHKPAFLDEIERLRKLGIVKRASSSVCNPVRIVVKKDGTLRQLSAMQARDEEIAKLRESLKSDDHKNYRLHEGIVFHKSDRGSTWAIVVPEELRGRLVRETHERIGHGGVYKIISELQQCYWWRGMRKRVKRFVSACDLCQTKYLNKTMIVKASKLRQLSAMQARDEEIAKLRESLKSDDHKNYRLHEGIVFHKSDRGSTWAIVVPEELRGRLVRETHERIGHGDRGSTWAIVVPEELRGRLVRETHERIGHGGVYKTTSELQQSYWWRGMRKRVKSFVSACDFCQRTKYLNKTMIGRFLQVKASRVNELVAVDYFGPLPRSTGGVEYIFVVLDVFSRHVALYALKKATAKATINRMRAYFEKVGKPERVLSDHGTQFMSGAWRDFLSQERVQPIYCSIRHPQANPSERIMLELGKFFRLYCNETHTAWARYLPQINYWLNHTAHSTTKYTPYELHYGVPNKNPFVYDIEHCSGKDNIIADYFSRVPPNQRNSRLDNSEQRSCISNIVAATRLISTWFPELRQLSAMQARDEEIAKLRENLKSDDHKNYRLHEGILRGRLVRKTHERIGHGGVYNTLNELQQCYWWRGMRKRVKSSSQLATFAKEQNI
ncbi:hypothetical protein TSAR_016671 [Trichomalopsis sarcophagae]|uniref:RNA-directed DNA polymerase n=1 Tax=Trichomalopsis sarcophagae TaxID=543379 RepID=A0A232EDM2_9HYME|nr:hypothetical protein TSAR_016671 [Trichomalopsis sarcophagae]